MSDQKIPDRIKGKVVPSTVQLYGETFHREMNLDAHFEDISKRAEAAEAQVVELQARVAELQKALSDAAHELEITSDYIACDGKQGTADAVAYSAQLARRVLSGSSELAQLRQAVVEAALLELEEHRRVCAVEVSIQDNPDDDHVNEEGRGLWEQACDLHRAARRKLDKACDNLAAAREGEE